MIKVLQARPLITWTLLAFGILVAFAALMLVPVWLKPPLSKADLSAYRPGSNASPSSNPKASCRTPSDPPCSRDWPVPWS